MMRNIVPRCVPPADFIVHQHLAIPHQSYSNEFSYDNFPFPKGWRSLIAPKLDKLTSGNPNLKNAKTL